MNTWIMPRKNELSEALRSQIVDLHKAGKGYKIIARTLDIHRSTVRKIVYKWKRFSTVATLPRSGRPTKSSAKTKISEVTLNYSANSKSSSHVYKTRRLLHPDGLLSSEPWWKQIWKLLFSGQWPHWSISGHAKVHQLDFSSDLD